jgi:hypothetical protein
VGHYVCDAVVDCGGYEFTHKVAEAEGISLPKEQGILNTFLAYLTFL